MIRRIATVALSVIVLFSVSACPMEFDPKCVDSPCPVKTR